MKQEEYEEKIANLREPGNGNEIEVMKLDVESYGEESVETGGPQQPVRQKFGKFGLKKIERDMKEGKNTGKIKNLTVLGTRQ